MRWVLKILDLIFPPRCILCRRILYEDQMDLCHNCREHAPEFPACPAKMHPSGKTILHFLDSFTAIWYYEGYVRRSILRYKFRHARQYAGGYGRLLAMKIAKEDMLPFDMITWVPISRQRRWTRGYDQSQLLAEAVGRELGMEPVRLLRKIRNNKRQSGMTAEQRKANVLGVYTAVGSVSIKDKRVLLVDDVFTTGSTAEECARVLLTAGAKEVHAATIAAAQRHEK